MNWINSCSRQRTLSGMHFSRKPLLAEPATRRPENKSGALKCFKKYVYAMNQDNVLCILFHSVLQTEKYTRNTCKAVEKCQKCFRTYIGITHVALHLLCFRVLPPLNLASQGLPAKNYVCVLHTSAHSMANALGNCFGRTVSADLWSDKNFMNCATSCISFS